eukprot:scaffold19173_cov156-Amphora_coffeaeformis.AAC.4
MLIWNYSFTIATTTDRSHDTIDNAPYSMSSSSSSSLSSSCSRATDNQDDKKEEEDSVLMFHQARRRRCKRCTITNRFGATTTSPFWMFLSPTLPTEALIVCPTLAPRRRRRRRRRRVHFAPKPIVEESRCSLPTLANNDNVGDIWYNPQDIWYSLDDYAQFTQSILAYQDDFAHSAWYRDLQCAYHAVLVREDEHDNHHHRHHKSDDDDTIRDVMQMAVCDDDNNIDNEEEWESWLGLEHWLCPKAWDRYERHETILDQIVEESDNGDPCALLLPLPLSPPEERVRQTSARIRHPVRMLALYIAQRVGKSEQQQR